MFSQNRSCLALLFLVCLPSIFADVVTCGGFVSTSSHLAQVVDYSSISVHLFTSEGLLKYSSQCSTQGDYFIPVYDKGVFYLEIEGPSGWVFDPAKYDFVVSDAEQGCQEDVNFVFTGFSLEGTVSTNSAQCDAASPGPSGVVITLINEGQTIATTESIDGRFQLPNLFPGTYTVTASHLHWAISNPTQALSVGMGNSELPSPFIVSGYQVNGSVLAERDEGVQGVGILLYSAVEPLSPLGCSQPTDDMHIPTDSSLHLLCATITDANGVFTLENIPCGEYSVVPYHQHTTTSFDVKPSQAPLAVTNSDASVASFHVLGFSGLGRVVDQAGKGVAGVSISVNGDAKTLTGDQGYYKAEQMSTGEYTVTAAKEHYEFRSITSHAISSLNPSFPDIVVSTFHVCGQVDLDNQSRNPRTMTLKGTGQQVGVVKTTQTNSNNRFCFFVTPGTYEITPTLTYTETSNGVVLSPPSAAITVLQRPVLNIDFSEARVKVSGFVRCITSPCTEAVKVTLTSDMSGTVTTYLDENDHFAFPSISPSQYIMAVDYDGWCWEEGSMVLQVGHNAVSDIEFVQSGYILHTSLSHDLSLNILLASSHDKEGSFQYDKTFALSKGNNDFCLVEPGLYSLTPKSCFRFEQDTYSYDTNKPGLLKLTASEVLVTGEVAVGPAVDFETLSTVPVAIRFVSGYNQAPVHRDATFSHTDNRQTDDASAAIPVRVYTYSFWAHPGTRVEVVTVSDKADDVLLSSLLFYPDIVTALVQDVCPTSVPPFAARPGLFLSGSVTPPVSGAQVTVTDNSDSGVAVQVTVDNTGAYRAGPLYDDKDYSVDLSFDGYLFTADSTGLNFKAQQLGRISLRVVVDGGDVMAGLADVYLSLSGLGQRSSNRTDSNGEYDFKNLKPGTYTLRPLLKEYEFQPASLSVDVEESTHSQQSFLATRSAFSVFGHVSSLNGDPEKGVSIEAIEVVELDSQGARVRPARSEDTTSDAQGNYRIQGLIPGFRYTIAIKGVEDRIEHAYPPAHHIDVQRQDTFGVDFVAFRSPNKFDLTGVVDIVMPDSHSEAGSAWALTPLMVEVSSAHPRKLMHSVAVSEEVDFFIFPPLPEDDYVVTVRPSSSSPAYEVSTSSIELHLGAHTHIIPSFQATLISTPVELDTNAMFPIFITLLCCLVMYRENVMTTIRTWQQGGDEEDAHTSSPNTSKKKKSAKRKQQRKKGSKWA